MCIRVRRLALIVGLAVSIAASVNASEAQPIPAFSVVSVSGANVPGSQLSPAARWLLIYVSPGCIPCDRLVAAVGEWQIAAGDRVVVVVGGTEDAMRTYAAARGGTTGSRITWFADPDHNAARALKVEHTPAIAGIEHGALQWSVSGVLNDPSDVKPLIVRWTAD